MRISIRFLLLLAPVLAGVILSFNGLMTRLERRWAAKDLNRQARLVFNGIQDPILEAVITGNLNSLARIYRRIDKDSSFKGVMICSKDGAIISKSANVPSEARCNWKVKKKGDLEAKAIKDSGPLEVAGVTFHRSIFPLIESREDDPGGRGFGVPDPSTGILGRPGTAAAAAAESDASVNPKGFRGYVLFFHDPTYLDQRTELTRRYTLAAFLLLGLFISLISLIVYRWSVSRPVEQLSQVMKGVLTGDTDKVTRALKSGDFGPLVKDLDQALVQFRAQKQGQALESAGGLWTAARLGAEVQRLFGESRICVVAESEPYHHVRDGEGFKTEVPASGTVNAFEPVLRACSGIWIGQGRGVADRESADKNGMILLPPENPEYALKRVWLDRHEEQGFYYGFSNEGLWPMCHLAHERPVFRHEDWLQYVSVNAKFANVFSEEMRSPRPIALIQDYHFALMPAMIRRTRPDALVTLSWHIPWPGTDSIRICPWRKDLLMGMLGADLIGFQSQSHCNNFLDSVDRFLEARVSRDQFSVTIQGRTCHVRPFPESVEWPSRWAVEASEIPEIRETVRRELALREDAWLAIGVDRLDYTKGIPERLLAFERMLESRKELVGRAVLLQVVCPDRIHLKRYQDLQSEIQKIAERINWKHSTGEYQPVILRMQHYSRERIFRFYRAADVCFVSALHDGMSLVAKEFVSARSDLGGVLVLSSFAGAARELKEALIVNPYDVEECADALRNAFAMPEHERASRMERMRGTLAQNNVYTWSARFFRELHSLGTSGVADPRAAEGG